VALGLYLDNCANSDLLRKAGHRVVRPTDPGVDMDGANDDAHFAYARDNALVIITKNPADILPLHEGAAPQHPGIFGVYQDNDPSRDLSNAAIVRAIANVEAASGQGGDPIPGHFFVLNEWRY